MFNFAFADDDWVFQGILFHNGSINSGDWSSFSVDVSGYYSWLNYDAPSESLSGLPPRSSSNESVTIPATLMVSNQTLDLSITIIRLPSYSLLFSISLESYVSNGQSFSGHEVYLSTSYDTSTAEAFLQLNQNDCDSKSGWCLSGLVPSVTVISISQSLPTTIRHMLHLILGASSSYARALILTLSWLLSNWRNEFSCFGQLTTLSISACSKDLRCDPLDSSCRPIRHAVHVWYFLEVLSRTFQNIVRTARNRACFRSEAQLTRPDKGILIYSFSSNSNPS